MNAMRIRVALVGFTLLCIGSCQWWHKDPPPADSASGKVVFVLFDISGSTTGAVRKRYLEDFKRILARVHAGDVIVADVISDNPLAQSTFPINEAFEKAKLDTDNPLIVNRETRKHEEKLKDRRDKIESAAEKVLLDESRKIAQTKIFEAMQLADRVFHTYARAAQVLVVFSDMIEESGRYNFQTQTLSDATIERILNDEKQNKRLPDLAGVRVYVVGAAASNYQRLPASSFGEIQNFWLRYFKEVGADLSKERYGAALLRFEE